jgi:hypothetical protein
VETNEPFARAVNTYRAGPGVGAEASCCDAGIVVLDGGEEASLRWISMHD